MARSTDRSKTNPVAIALCLALGACALAACGDPSKSAALAVIERGVKEDGSCTLPLEIVTSLKMQHATKGACVPKQGGEKAKACMEALAAAGVTARKNDAYMVAWPDELAGVGLTDVPAYERRARNLLFDACYELGGSLREGRFECADAKAEKVLAITKVDDTRVGVRYARAVTERPFLGAVDAACGRTTRPPGDATASLEKRDAGWAIAAPRDADDD